MSKQCCPACARLFHCLLGVYDKKDDCEDWPKILTQAFASHAMPYPVRLPQWLPDNIIDGMVTSFRPHLMQALDLLAYLAHDIPKLPTNKVHHSQQSQSNISVGSSNAEVISTAEMMGRFTSRDLHGFGQPMRVTGMGTHGYGYGSHFGYPRPLPKPVTKRGR